MGIVKSFLVLSIFSGAAFADGTQSRILLDETPTRESAGRELVQWEAFKLIYGKASNNPNIEIPEDLALDPMLRDRLEAMERARLGQRAVRPKGPLTLTQVIRAFREGEPALPQDQVHELISVLRMQNAKGTLTGTPEARARALLLQELTNWAKDPNVPVTLAPELRLALAAEARARAVRGTPPKVLTDVQINALLKDPLKVAELASALPITAFGLGDWMRLGADLRTAARVNRPASFLADLRAEADERLAAVSVERQQERGVQAPRVPFSAPRPSFSIPSDPSPAPKLSSGGGGFNTQPEYGHKGKGGTGRGGSVVLDGPPAAEISFTASEEAKLEAERDRGRASLPFITHYKRSPSASCQITLVGNPSEPPTRVSDTECSYNAMSARHCGEDDFGERFTHAEIPPFASIKVTKLDVDPSGGDLLMVAFQAECRNDLPIVSLSIIPPREGEGIVVHAAVPILGQASSNGGSVNRLMMNVRHRANGGVGIQHGNSGGLVTNGRGEAVGVISSRLTDARYDQVGFFASREALYFANRFLNPNFDQLYLTSLRGEGGRSPASLEHGPESQ